MGTQLPVLTTSRVVWCGFQAADWDAYAEMNADPEVE